jgi:hypothetical protein
VFNLYDLTGGTYRVQRTLSFPQYPNSSITFDTDVTAASATEWETNLNISGTYDGPTDVVSVQDYEVNWTVDGNTLLETGSATLVLSSGGTVRSEWSSSITAEGQDFRGFSPSGQLVRVTYSPFRIDADSMSYDWEGTVSVRDQ